MPDDKNVPHGPAFFAQMRECRDRYRLLGEAMGSVLTGCETVLNIGCGIGVQTAKLCELGYFATGVDAFDAGPELEPGFPFLQVDVLEHPFSEPFDAVICTETAEHIYPERADRLVEVVTGMMKKRLIWSAAIPGQEWEGHVNLQPHGYWLGKLALRGLSVHLADTTRFRTTMVNLGAQHSGVPGNFFVLERAS